MIVILYFVLLAIQHKFSEYIYTQAFSCHYRTYFLYRKAGVELFEQSSMRLYNYKDNSIYTHGEVIGVKD